MADIQPTLDLIDGAIEDYISPDAMRWTPDENQRAETSPAGVRTFAAWMAEQMRLYLLAQEPPVAGSAYTPPRGIISAVPTATAAPTDIIGNIRWLYERLRPDYQVIVPPSTADRPTVIPDGIEVEVSNLVPDGQVYVVNRRALGQAQREALSNMSFVYDTTPIAAEIARLQSERISRVFGVPTWAINPASGIVDEIHVAQAARRARMRYLHVSYRSRQLARRRRHR